MLSSEEASPIAVGVAPPGVGSSVTLRVRVIGIHPRPSLPYVLLKALP